MVLQMKLEQFKSSNYDVPELPKVDLPTFNGNAKNWPTFNELFSDRQQEGSQQHKEAGIFKSLLKRRSSNGG